MRNLIVRLDAFFCLIIGTILFVAPSYIAQFIFVKSTDGVHWHLLRCVGGQLMSASFIIFRLSKSNGESMSSCYLIRILGNSLILLIEYHCSAMTPELMHAQVLKIAKYWSWTWLAINIVLQTMQQWRLGCTLNFENKLGNFLYQFDTLASLAIGSAWLAFPKWLLHRQVIVTLTESHEFCARLMGANFLTSYAISAHALYWKAHSDRMAAIDARAVMCAAILMAQFWSQIAYFEDWSGNHWVGIALFSTWTIICAVYRIYMTFRTRNGIRQKAKFQ